MKREIYLMCGGRRARSRCSRCEDGRAYVGEQAAPTEMNSQKLTTLIIRSTAVCYQEGETESERACLNNPYFGVGMKPTPARELRDFSFPLRENVRTVISCGAIVSVRARLCQLAGNFPRSRRRECEIIIECLNSLLQSGCVAGGRGCGVRKSRAAASIHVGSRYNAEIGCTAIYAPRLGLMEFINGGIARVGSNFRTVLDGCPGDNSSPFERGQRCLELTREGVKNLELYAVLRARV